MKKIKLPISLKSITLSIMMLLVVNSTIAQTGNPPVSFNSMVIILFAVMMFTAVFLIAVLADKIIKLYSAKSNKKVGIIPSLKEIIPTKSKN